LRKQDEGVADRPCELALRANKVSGNSCGHYPAQHLCIGTINTVNTVRAINTVNTINTVRAIRAISTVNTIRAVRAIRAISTVNTIRAVRAISTVNTIRAIIAWTNSLQAAISAGHLNTSTIRICKATRAIFRATN
jgi:hypothetical protein